MSYRVQHGLGAGQVILRGESILPRLYALRWISGTDEPDDLIVGIEVSTLYGEPVIELEIEFPWRRPRPWWPELHYWPPKRLGRLGP